MILLVTALYNEAEPFLKHYGLTRKDPDFTAGQYFCSPDASETAFFPQLSVLVTGTGEIRAASVLSLLLGRLSSESGRKSPLSFLVNFGTAGSRAPACTGTYQIRKITETASNRDFYPDLLYKVPLPEAELMTLPAPWKKDTSPFPETSLHSPDVPVLCDMEAAAIYQAASFFYSPEQILIWKTVSDQGEAITRNSLALTAREAAEQVFPILNHLKSLSQKLSPELIPTDDSESRDYQSLLADFHASAAMKSQILQMIRYLKAAGKNPQDFFAPLYQEGKLPSCDRKTGKEVLKSLESCF